MQFESLVESLVDWVLHEHFSLFGRCSRHIDHHIGEGILKEHTLCDGSGLLSNAQRPLDLLGIRIPFPKLEHSIAIGIEIAPRAFSLADEEDVGIIGGCASFDMKQLPLLPVSKSQLDVFREVLKDQSGQCMHNLIRILLLNVLDHPNLVQILVVRWTNRWHLAHIIPGLLRSHDECTPGRRLHDLIVISLLKLDLLHG